MHQTKRLFLLPIGVPEILVAMLGMVMGVAAVLLVVHEVNVLTGVVGVVAEVVSQVKIHLIMLEIGEMTFHRLMTGIMKSILAH